VKAPAFSYARPHTLEEVFDLLDEHGEDVRILAGGQSLLATLNLRLSAPALLVDITSLDFGGIRHTENRLVIGALTTHREVEHSALVRQYAPLLAAAMPHVAHVAIRNRGTIGGSLALADPSAEWPACAVALDAHIIVQSRQGQRGIAAREFFVGLYETALKPGELIVGVEFDAAAPGDRSFFDELARRHGDYAAVGLASHARNVAGHGLTELRLVFFGAGVAPVMLPDLVANRVNSDINDLSKKLFDLVDQTLVPPGDLHFSSAAKLHLAKVLAGRAIDQLIKVQE
jgi:aerobic carbon-monoxide dehydrogenase medium subunit